MKTVHMFDFAAVLVTKVILSEGTKSHNLKQHG